MKRILSIFACLMLLVAIVCTAVACGPKDEGGENANTNTECTHEYTSAVTKEATCGAEGVKTFTCSKCQATKTEPIAPTEQHTVVADEAVPAKCGVAGKTAGSHCSVCEKVIVAQTEVKALEHNYVDNKCSNCGQYDPSANLTIYTLDANTLTVTSWTTDGEQVTMGTDDFFTLITKNGAKVESTKDVEYEDGYVPEQRISLNGKINWVKDADDNWYVDKTAISFTVDSACTVRVWWMAGKPSGYENGQQTDRYISIQNAAEGKYAEVGHSDMGCVNVANFNEFEIDAAGTYYVANWGGNNYIYKIEVVIAE